MKLQVFNIEKRKAKFANVNLSRIILEARVEQTLN